MSGCFTMRLYDAAHQIGHETFVASAVYQESSGQNVALQEKLRSEHSEGASKPLQVDSADARRGAEVLVGGADRRPSSPAKLRYLVLPQEQVAPGLSPTNAGPWLEKLQSRWAGTASKAKLRDKLPGDYEKVADLPDGATKLNLQRGPYKGWMALAPVTVAADVATSPIQILFVTVLLLSGAHM